MNKNFYKRTSIKTLLAVIFSIVFLIGCYSKENFVAKSPTPAQNENVSNITNKDIQDFLSSIRKVDGNLDPQYRQALYLQKKGKHKIAIQLLKEVIQKDPLCVQAYNAMGISYDHLRNYDRAIKFYKLALTLNPNLHYVYNNLGYSYLLNANPDSAIDAFKKAIALDTNNKRYHNNLALAYLQKEQFDLALEQFTIAADEISANRKLGQLLYRRNKFELAKKYYARANQLESSAGNMASAKAPAKQKSSILSLKVDEKPQQSESPEIVADSGRKSFEEKKRSVSENLPSYSKPKLYKVEADKTPRKSPIIIRKSIVEVSETADHYNKKKTNLIKADTYSKKNESQKRLADNEKIASSLTIVAAEIEVSNGNGVNRMARRVGNDLKDMGLNVTRLTNADHFGYKKTKIYYLSPYLHDAYKVAKQIPGWQNMEKVDKFSRQNTKIRVLIGKDIIPYRRPEKS
jgi:Flp pilus assembly protein TadD